jgi:hypothetical protein
MPFWGGDEKRIKKQSEYERLGAFGGYDGDDVDEKFEEYLAQKNRREEEERRRREEREREREERLRREAEEYDRKIRQALDLANRKKQKSWWDSEDDDKDKGGGGGGWFSGW